MNKLDELWQEYQELGEAIKRLEGNGGQWKPEIGEDYWFILYNDMTGAPMDAFETVYNNDTIDKILLRKGIMYRTQEEAERALEMEKYEFERSLHIADVNRIIDEANGEWVADWSRGSQTKAILVYDHFEGCLDFETWCLLEPCSELKIFNRDAFDQITSRITQEQIDYIWRLNKPEGVK